MKILDELPNHVLGDGQFCFPRGREINIKKIQREFSRFIERFPYELAKQRANDFEHRSPSQDIDVLLAQLEAAIRGHKGLSFVRMGDGEGRFVGISREYRRLYDQSKRIAKNIWYNYSKVPNEKFYDNLEGAYANASIVGYVPAHRLELEAKNVWYGYFGCVCGNEFIDASLEHDIDGNAEKLVRNWTAVNMVGEATFSELLRTTGVGIVTCHPHQGVFVEKFGLTHIEHFVIPPQYHPLLENHSSFERLYPDQYLEIMASFGKSDTQVYLIGAGVFAKIFCEHLRKLGKVGLDLGSVLDNIAGVATRPPT